MRNKNVREIAKRIGVSPASVSRYLSGYNYVSNEMKFKIQMALDELEKDKAQPINKTIIISYILRKETFSYYSSLIDELCFLLIQNQFNVEIIPIRLDATQQYYQKLELATRYMCVILIGGVTPREIIKGIRRCKIPLILLDNEYYGSFSVNIDNFSGVYNAMRYLYQLGHREIAFIGASQRRYVFYQRFLGYQIFMRQHNLEENVAFYQECDFYTEGINMTQEVFNRAPFTALVCSGETMMIGAVSYLSSQNMQIPKDLSIISCGDTEISRNFYPPITSLSLMKKKLSSSVLELVKQIHRGDSTPLKILIWPELICRQSCRSLLLESSQLPSRQDNDESPM